MAYVIIQEADQTRTVELREEELKIGRAADNGVVLDDTKSSRKHCLIRRRGDDFELVDLESRNGTRLNGKYVNRGILSEGDVIQIGGVTITFKTGVPEKVPAPGEDEDVIEGVEVPARRSPRARGRFGRGRIRKARGGRPAMTKKEQRLRRQETTAMHLVPAKPQATAAAEPPPSLPANLQNAETAEVAPAPPTPPKGGGGKEIAGPERGKPTDQRRPTMKRFHLIQGNRVYRFVREPANRRSDLPLETLFAEASSVIEWEDIFRLEGLQPAREFGRASATVLLELKDSEGNRSALLLVDSAGILTVVERGGPETNHRALIGKGLNLAAFMATEWTGESLRTQARNFAKQRNTSLDDLFRSRLGNVPTDAFWEQVETNLRRGRIRFLFLVDEATVAAQKVIDFLYSSTNMSAYALQFDTYAPADGESKALGFTVKLYEPSKSARAARASNPGQVKPALGVVGR